jgi:membrane associated rhomboid family serine protease
MILLVPTNPEVPQALKPKIWPSMVMVGLILLGYLSTKDILKADNDYVESVETSLNSGSSASQHLDANAEQYLSLRPLLAVAPAKGDWNFERLLKANFIHGSPSHLLLNSIGLFAGIRICTTFMPFLSATLIFLIGGTLGLWASVFTSKQISDFIPHVGASAGLFTLMGTYYVFNFRFRTQYFFWLPIRRGFVSLKTSWFFFVDVILLELILSAAQFFPNRVDSIDHVAHVVGFTCGIVLALVYRLVLRWPNFLQTRAEYIYWQFFVRDRVGSHQTKLQTWLGLLQINRYNDFLKRRLCHSVASRPNALSDSELNDAFKFFAPTYVRLNTLHLNRAIKSILAADRHLPRRWLSRLPYDIFIRLAKDLAENPKDHSILYQLLKEFKKAQDNQKRLNASIDNLMNSLQSEEKTPTEENTQKTG